MAFYGIAIVVVVLDQASKWIAIHIADGGPLLGDFLRLTLTYNTGAAFGLFPGARLPFVIISGVAALGLVYAHHVLSSADRARRIPLALVLGGTLGNLIDRVRVGRVTDFIDMGLGDLRWPTYNVADIAVVAGAAALAARLVTEIARERGGAHCASESVDVRARESVDAG